ncbi:STAS domain-containing protein [Lacticaseibacillus rhamnosus]
MGDAVVLHVAGEVDVFTAPQLREALVGAIEEGSRDVIVDLQGVDFLDSTGLGVLVAGLKRVRQYGGDLSLVCTREHILKILDITEMPETIDVVLINRPEIPASGAGEPSMRPTPAAIANAIFDATGVRIRRVPFSPERVKAAFSA